MACIDLVVISGPSNGVVREVDEKGLTVGRSSRADFTISDPMISRLHFRCYIQEGIPYIFDMESANGTLLNDVEIEGGAVTIKHGDIISIGNTKIRVEINSGSGEFQTQKVKPIAVSTLDALNSFSMAQNQDSALRCEAIQPVELPHSTHANTNADAHYESSHSSLQETPPKNEELNDFYLDMDESREEEALPAEDLKEEERGTRMLIIALASFLIVVLLLVVTAFMLAKKEQAKESPPVVIDSLSERAMRAKQAVLSYEHLKMTEDGIYQYLLSYNSEDCVLTLRVYEVGKTQREIEESTCLVDDDAKRMINILNTFPEVPAQESIILSNNEIDRYRTHVVLGKNIYEQNSQNRQTEAYRVFTTRLEEFALSVLNIEEIAHLSIKELINYAEQALIDAEVLEQKEMLGGDALYKSFLKYKEARSYLKTVNPKPDFVNRIERGYAATEKKIDAAYQELKIALSHARSINDQRAECDALDKILRLIPDSNDERYREAQRAKERLESHNQWM